MSTLFPHQIKGIEFIQETHKCILADDMGLGKTRQAIVALGELQDMENIIIVCPASLKTNWMREIAMIYPIDKVCILHSKKAEIHQVGVRMEIAATREVLSARWIIVNYDILGKVEDMLSLAGKHALVLDEAHYVKSRKSARSKSVIQMAKRADRVVAMTGTPMLNRPIELFSLLWIIDHPMFTTTSISGEERIYGIRYCGGYLMRLRNGKSFFTYKGATNMKELSDKIAPYYLRRKKEEVLDLPEKIISVINIDLTDDQMDEYQNAFTEYMEFLNKNAQDILENDPYEYFERMDKIENILRAQHIVEIQKVKQVASLQKVDAIVEHAESLIESGQKVVIFTQYTQTLHTLAQRLEKHGVVTIDGSTSQDERTRAVDLFQGKVGNKPQNVFIGNIKAAGVGITLTAASNVLFADLEWSPGIHDQAMDRCHRIGQHGTVNVYYYIANGTIEEDIYRVLDEKRKLIAKIVDNASDVKISSIFTDILKAVEKRLA